MTLIKTQTYFYAIILLSLLLACQGSDQAAPILQDKEQTEKEVTDALEYHLRAVREADAETLASTLSPTGELYFMLPGTELSKTTEAFMEYHRAWFGDEDLDWSFKTKILDVVTSDDLALAIVEVVYSEPDRDGVPYFNRMSVSYTLRKENGKWYVIKDHASSIEKSTDKK